MTLKLMVNLAPIVELQNLRKLCWGNYPVGNCMFEVNNENTRARCEIYSKLIIKTPKRRQWRRSGVFLVNFKHISHFFLVSLLLTLSRQMPAG